MPIRRRQQPWAKAAPALAALLMLPLAACKHAPESPSRLIAEGQQSRPEAAATPNDAARSPVQVPVQGPRFAVQIAALDDRSSAEVLASRLSDHFGLQTMVAPVESKGATLYRVRLLVENRDDAEKLAETFQHTENLKVWIVPL